MKKKVC